MTNKKNKQRQRRNTGILHCVQDDDVKQIAFPDDDVKQTAFQDDDVKLTAFRMTTQKQMPLYTFLHGR